VHKPETYDAGISHQIGRYSDALVWPSIHVELEAVALVPSKDEPAN